MKNQDNMPPPKANNPIAMSLEKTIELKHKARTSKLNYDYVLRKTSKI